MLLRGPESGVSAGCLGREPPPALHGGVVRPAPAFYSYSARLLPSAVRIGGGATSSRPCRPRFSVSQGGYLAAVLCFLPKLPPASAGGVFSPGFGQRRGGVALNAARVQEEVGGVSGACSASQCGENRGFSVWSVTSRRSAVVKVSEAHGPQRVEAPRLPGFGGVLEVKPGAVACAGKPGLTTHLLNADGRVMSANGPSAHRALPPHLADTIFASPTWPAFNLSGVGAGSSGLPRRHRRFFVMAAPQTAAALLTKCATFDRHGAAA